MTSVTVIRHPREKRSKCSLTPLEGRPDVTFVRAFPGFRFDASGFTLLELKAPVISRADAGRPLLLLDSTWRLLPRLRNCLTGVSVPRSLPAVPTAYPRASKIDRDPAGGLASIEALFLAKLLLGERDDALLEAYRWRDGFLGPLEKAGFLLP